MFRRTEARKKFLSLSKSDQDYLWSHWASRGRRKRKRGAFGSIPNLPPRPAARSLSVFRSPFLSLLPFLTSPLPASPARSLASNRDAPRSRWTRWTWAASRALGRGMRRLDRWSRLRGVPEWSATITGVTTLMPGRRRITPQLRPTTPTVSTQLLPRIFLFFSFFLVLLAFFWRLSFFCLFFLPEKLSSRFKDRLMPPTFPLKT